MSRSCVALVVAVFTAACAAAVTVPSPAAARVAGRSSGAARAAPAPTVTVGHPAAVAPTSTRRGFLGIATELNTIPALAGPAAHPDTAVVNLLQALSPGAPMQLRLGGNSADFSRWPTRGAKRPPYAYTLTPRWGADVRALLAALGGRAILGLNLEAGAAVVRTEVADFDRYLGRHFIDAFELGNEPEFYPWTQVGRYGRTHDPRAAYAKRFAHYGRVFVGIASTLGKASLVGPGTGSPRWLSAIGTVVGDMPSQLKLVTVHAYPLKNCSNYAHVSVADFFRRSSIHGLADSVRAAVRAAAAHGKPLRVDEMNGITCGGKAGFSNSFAEALWALNVLPALWRAGVQGADFQTVDGGRSPNYNQVITARRSRAGWRVSVEPVYYGLLAFARVAPAGSRLLTVSNPGLADVYQYAVRAPNGSERVVLTNVGSAARTIGVAAPGRRGHGSLSYLTASSLTAAGAATLAGQSLSARTGRLAGRFRVATVARDAGRVYDVRVPPHAAAILTLSS